MSLFAEFEKTLGSFHLRVNIQAESERLALLGASGCGKSMTLKCIAGIIRPDRGRIELDGKILFDSERKIDLPPQKRQIGYLFQQYALFPNMTVEQNIAAGIRKKDKSARTADTEQLLHRMHLDGLGKRLPAQLSGGQQQRVALARILASEPKAILLDEPFSALDSFLKWNLEMELDECLSGFNGPILWVSHDKKEVYRHCARVCVMERGRSQSVVPMEELWTRPETVSAARLMGCRNFLTGRVSNGTFTSELWKLSLPWPEEGAGRILGIPANALEPDGDDLTGTVRRVLRDADHQQVQIQPLSGEEGYLCAELPGDHPVQVGQPVGFRLNRDRLLQLREASEEG